jgi:hypothetical protein
MADRDTLPAPPPEEADPASLVAAELRKLTQERDHARAELRHLREQLERLAARYGWM